MLNNFPNTTLFSKLGKLNGIQVCFFTSDPALLSMAFLRSMAFCHAHYQKGGTEKVHRY